MKIWTSTRRRAHHTAWPFLSSPLSDENDVDVAETIEQKDALDGIHVDSPAPNANTVSNPHKTLKLPILGTVARDAPVNTPRIRPISDTVADGLTSGSSPSSNASSQTKSAKVILPEQIKVVEKTQMLEINPGIWDGLTPDQAKKYYPEDWDRFTKDPYSYRVPRAESYHDLSGTSRSWSHSPAYTHRSNTKFDWNLYSSNSNAKAKIYLSSDTHLLFDASSHTS